MQSEVRGSSQDRSEVHLYFTRKLIGRGIWIYGAINPLVTRASQDPRFAYQMQSDFEGERNWEIDGTGYLSRIFLHFSPSTAEDSEKSNVKMNDLVREIMGRMSWRGRLVHAEASYRVLGVPLGKVSPRTRLWELNPKDLTRYPRRGR